MMTKYLVRQYRPAYFTGFHTSTAKDVEYGKILDCPWFRNFEHEHDGGFDKFVIEPYGGDELIISAYYKNGKHWVAGFALPDDSDQKAPDGGLLRDNWRYKDHES